MMIDLEVLKELLAKANKLPWAVTDGRGSIRATRIYQHADGSTSALFSRVVFGHDGTSEQRDADFALIVAAVNSLPALIAKAERVDALTEALKPFAEIGTGEVFEAFAARARNNLAVCNPDGRRLCFVNAECFDAARNALSPKESE